MARNKSNEGSGPGYRQLRVAELIRRRLSEIFMRGEIHDPDLNRISITVGDVRLSGDLKVATIFVVPLGGKAPENMMDLIKRNRVEIRRLVSRGLNLKFAPELRFQLDKTFDHLDDSRRLFAQDAVRRDIED